MIRCNDFRGKEVFRFERLQDFDKSYVVSKTSSQIVVVGVWNQTTDLSSNLKIARPAALYYDTAGRDDRAIALDDAVSGSKNPVRSDDAA